MLRFQSLVLSTKRRYFSFLKKVFAFEKICFKFKVLKTFKFSSDCDIKSCRSFKRGAILEISAPYTATEMENNLRLFQKSRI